MDVGMKGKFLVPGVKDGQTSHPGTQRVRSSTDSRKGFMNREEESAVDRMAVGKCQGDEFMGNREDDMEIGTGQKFAKTRLNPPGPGSPLAERTMPVTAGVVVYFAMTTLAGKDITPEVLSLAVGHVRKDTAFLTGEPGEVHAPSRDVTQRAHRELS